MRPLVAFLIIMLFGVLVGQSHGLTRTTTGSAVAIKAVEKTLVLAVLHESGPLKIAPLPKSQAPAGNDWTKGSPLSPPCRYILAVLPVARAEPELPRSPWVGVVELRI